MGGGGGQAETSFRQERKRREGRWRKGHPKPNRGPGTGGAEPPAGNAGSDPSTLPRGQPGHTGATRSPSPHQPLGPDFLVRFRHVDFMHLPRTERPKAPHVRATESQPVVGKFAFPNYVNHSDSTWSGLHSYTRCHYLALPPPPKDVSTLATTGWRPHAAMAPPPPRGARGAPTTDPEFMPVCQKKMSENSQLLRKKT